MRKIRRSGRLLDVSRYFVCASVRNRRVSTDELRALLVGVSAALERVAASRPAEALRPAAPIEDAVRPDRIRCLEDGLPFKSLKRHLRVAHGLSPKA